MQNRKIENPHDDLSPWQFQNEPEFQQEFQQEEEEPQQQQQQQGVFQLISLFNNQEVGQKKRQYKINTSAARSELKLLRKIIYRYGWKEVTSNGDVYWQGLAYSGQSVSCFEQRVNRFPGMDMLSHKQQSSFYLKKFSQYFPEEFQFFPKTYNMPEESNLFTDNYNSHKIYIAKPDAGSQGDGIYLIRSLKDVKMNDSVIVQEYIHKPLLIDSKKFDLRLFVLVSSLSPFICYINQEGLARFCTVNYEKVTQNNMRNPFMHLTNYSLNKRSTDYKAPNGNLLEINDASKRTFTSVKKNMEQLGHNVQQIIEQIEELSCSFLKSLYPFLRYNCRMEFQKRADEAKCFQVLGLDVLIDDDGKPWLLEVNANPSLNMEHEVFGKDGKSVFEDSELDEYVKSLVVGDAIRLVMKSKQKQLDTCQIFNSYKMLDIEQELDENIISKMLVIYGYISGHKFLETVTASKFCKLATLPNMTNATLVKYDYDLIYRKIIQKQRSNQMDFFQFIEAMELVGSRLNEDVEEMIDRIIGNIN